MHDRITYLGHATTLLETSGLRFLTDPALRRRILHITRRSPVPALSGLGNLDAVLISHSHPDHLDVRTLRRLELKCPVIAPKGLGSWLAGKGIREVIEVTPGERVNLGEVEVVTTPALHDGRRYPLRRFFPAVGYIIDGTSKMYFAGDTDVFAGMGDLAENLDVALLPIWGWGSRVGPGHLDPQRAAEAAAMLSPRVAVPIHWGTFAAAWMRLPDPTRPARLFSELAAELAPNVDVRILDPGETLEL